MTGGTPSVFAEFAVTLAVALLASALALVIAPRFPKTRLLALSPRAADRVFFLFALAYVLVFGTLSLLRHDSFHSGGYDLGVFDQTVWNSLHGRLLERSITIDASISLAEHFSPILLALVPLYAVWSDVRTLLILQTLALALSALPLYWFARQKLGAPLALVVAAAYFLSPALQSVNLFEFHEIALATPLLMFAIYFLLRHRDAPFLICLGLALITKEEVAFIVAAFGVYIFLARRQRALGAGLVVLGVAWAAATLLWIIPAFRDAVHGTTYLYANRYAYLGASVTEIVRNAITQPGLVLQHLLVPGKIEFVLQLLVPLVLLPLVGLDIFAMTLPTFGYLLLTDFPANYSIRFQYTAPLLPFIFFAAVVGAARLLRSPRGSSRATARQALLAALIGVASSANYLFQSPGPLGGYFDSTQYAITAHTQLGHRLIDQIPADASVMADSNLAPHLTDRRYAYQTSVVPDLRKIDYLLADKTLPVREGSDLIWQDVLPSPFFETLVAQDGYTLKKRAPYIPAQPLAIQFGDQITLFGYTVESSQPAPRGDRARIVLVWRADQNIRARYVAFIHLVDAQDRIVAQDDHEPANGWFRTDRWDAGAVTPDRFTLELPPDLLAGEYRIATGFYRTSDQQNLSAHDARGKPLGVAPTIGTLIVK